MRQQNVKFLATAMIPAAAAATLAADARAALLTPGGAAQDFFTSLTDRPELVGPVIASQLIPVTLRASDGSALHTLTILNEVLRNSPASTLTFSYRVVNDADGIIGIDRLDADSFAGFGVDVASIIDGGGETSPELALRGDNGARITFDFDDAASRISAGASSFDFLVKTDATRFDRAGNIELVAFTAASIDEGSDPIALGVATAAAFQPTSSSATIPLPPPAQVGIPTAIAVTVYTLRRQRRGGQPTA